MKKRTKYLFCLVALAMSFACSSEEPPVLAVPDIPVFVTQAQDVPVHQEFVGQIYGFKDIAINARVEGFLEGMHFQEGSRVKQGVLLYTLESQPFEADVAAKMSRVAESKTILAKTASDLARIRPLAEQKAVSESDLDSALAMHEAAQASLEATEALLRASRIQLGYTTISSPITGIIGKTQAKVGDFVGRAPNPVILNVVSRIDTILVEFFITETQYLQMMRRITEQPVSREQAQRQLELELILADGSLYEHKGRFEFVDREVDPTTGAILIQLSFPNPDEIIRPGQFARIKAEMDVVEGGILIPQRCVTELQGLFRVYVVNNQNLVELRDVTVGPKLQNFWLVLEGLEPDEKVVYEGLQRMRPGIEVNPVVQDIDSPIPDKQ
jgi:membrane fusion protein (multidrug efflux system)